MEIKGHIHASDLVLLLRKYKRLIVFVALLSGTVFTVAAFVMPKRFKVKTTINISTSYFQNALVRDFIPEITDTAEIRAQRESLIRLAISTEFLEEVGRKYGMIQAPPGTPMAIFETEELRKKIEIFGMSATTLQIGVQAADADAAYGVAQAVLSRVLDALRAQRLEKLKSVRDSLRRRIGVLGLKSSPATDAEAGGDVDVLEEELSRLQAQIQALRNEFTAAHPKIVQLNRRVEMIEKWIARRSKGGIKGEDDGAAASVPVDRNSSIHDDLARKLNYLEIVLDAESSGKLSTVAVIDEPQYPLRAFWPNKPMLLMWGLAIGLLIAAVLIAVLESIANHTVRIHNLAVALGTTVLGRLPHLGGVAPSNARGLRAIGRRTLAIGGELKDPDHHDRIEQ